jgi:hypothetical protein
MTTHASQFSLVPQKRTWDDAQQFCGRCMGGRLAVLDTPDKHAAAVNSLHAGRVVGHLADLAGSVVYATGVPGAADLATMVADSDMLFATSAHIGMRSVPGVAAAGETGNHVQRWFCQAPGSGPSKPCLHGDAGGILSPVVDQSSVRQATGKGWGWNVLDSTWGGASSSRKESTAYMLRGMWDGDSVTDRKRYFVCEFDEGLRPLDGPDAWRQYCLTGPA